MAEPDPLDPAIFRNLSQSSADDRRSLLRIQAFTRARKTGYRYVEIGSFLGGTLLPHLIDPACASLVSIDRRPQGPQPDARGDEWAKQFTYEGVTTEIMRQFLEPHVTPEQLAKLTTIDADASEVEPERIGPCDLALVDGEHTDRAVLSDVSSLMPVLSDDAVVIFHDVDLIRGGIEMARARLDEAGRGHAFFALPDVVGLIALGASREAARAAFGSPPG